jgi:aldose 1-epimerase
MEIKHISYVTDHYNEKYFGITPNSETIYSYEIANKNGMQLQLINYGATITALKIPKENGELLDVVLGFDNLQAYIDSFDLEGAPYFGATIGRFAGRINNGTFELNGKIFELDKNNGKHNLHGGKNGFSQKVWQVSRIDLYKNPTISLTYTSANNESNFPGALTIELTYTLTDKNELIIEYNAKTTEDTIVNLTHHSYFNLDGHTERVVDQELFINSKKIVETSNENIPTGRFLNLSNCPFDFTIPKNCPGKIDTTFVLDQQTKLAASLYSKKNNLKMYVYTNQPAVHIYVGGNCFGSIKGKENADYHSLSGICFETQNFPDAPNHNNFPSAVLKKDALYYQKTCYQFQNI